jgi:AraC-like DNA-binding protein
MSTRISMTDWPESDRLDYMREAAAALWVPMDFTFSPVAPPWAEFRASGLGPMQVVVIDCLPAVVHRTPKLIAQADPDLMKAFLVLDGASVVGQGDNQALLTTGDLAVYDTRCPYDITLGANLDELTRLRGLTFTFPPSLLPLSRAGIGELAGTRIPPTPGLGDLTSQFLLQLARNIDSYTPAEAARLSTAALEVLATRLARELDIRSWGTHEARKHALLTTVQGFICQHLAESWLCPADVAAAHHMSLRSLHQLFHDEGLTVAGWIRRRRLEQCRRDLTDPALDARPVAAIAARWGFASAADFSRSFRAAHGVPPAEYRRLARTVKEPAP